MKKEFIDHLYELRAKLQSDIDLLVEQSKQPTARCCDKMSCNSVTKVELAARREHIFNVNKIIENYFETHSKNI